MDDQDQDRLNFRTDSPPPSGTPQDGPPGQNTMWPTQSVANPISNPISNPVSTPQPEQPYQPQPIQPPPSRPQFQPTLEQNVAPAPPPQPQSQPQPQQAYPAARPAMAPASDVMLDVFVAPSDRVKPAPTVVAPVTAKPAVPKNRKKMFIISGAVAAVLVLGAGLFMFSSSSGLGTKNLKNDNFAYSFKFYKQAVPIQNGGQNAYKYQSSTIASVQATNDAVSNNCSQLGTKWKKVYSVMLFGSERPVCAAGTGTLEAYAVIFPSLSSNHLFLITTYSSPRTASTDSTMKTIFQSVKVSK